MSNIFSFCGNIGRDAEVRFLPSGQAVLNVTVANTTGFGDKQATQWVRVVLWGKRAEGSLKDYLKKGQQIFVSGELTTSTYKKNDGTDGFALEVNANILDLVGKKSDNPQPQPAPVQSYAPPPQPAYVPPHEAYRQSVAAHNAQQQDHDIPF